MTDSRRTVSRGTRKSVASDQTSPEPKKKRASDANPYLDEEIKPAARKRVAKRATKRVEDVESAQDKPSRRPRAAKAVSKTESIQTTSAPRREVSEFVANTDATAAKPAPRRGRPPRKQIDSSSSQTAGEQSHTSASDSRNQQTQLDLHSPYQSDDTRASDSSSSDNRRSFDRRHRSSNNSSRFSRHHRDNIEGSSDVSSTGEAGTGSMNAGSSAEDVSGEQDRSQGGYRGRFNRFRNNNRGRQGQGGAPRGPNNRQDRDDRNDRSTGERQSSTGQDRFNRNTGHRTHNRNVDRNQDRHADRTTDRFADRSNVDRSVENNGHRSFDRNAGGRSFNNNRRNFNNNRRRFDSGPRTPSAPIEVSGSATGWFDPHRESGFVRSAANSYLAETNDPFVPAHIVRQYSLRRGDLVEVATGRDPRNRVAVVDVTTINGKPPEEAQNRPEFQSLIASYPQRKLTLETGKPAKGGPELTRRAIDLIAPIGYGQRALIVAPARAGKTMLLQAVIEGIAVNHPKAALFVLLVDERPEEVSDMISLGHGEVIASSFDMPAGRHAEVAEMTLERARRLTELGQDVVIVLDSITRLARAYNTVERGTGRTMSGGLDSSAMAKPKAFFGSARSVAEEHGGGSLTIIATALVETGSRMDDVIFEEFKGTGNCEIKLDRALAEKRIFPAIDIPVSGTRREDKLFRPDQLEHVYTLRRGLQQMPSSSAMEWLIKRIAATTNNDALLSGL